MTHNVPDPTTPAPASSDEGVKRFDLGDVLSISDGRLVSPRHMDGVYDILNFMTGDRLFTHQLPRAIRVCGPELLRQHPQLADVDTSVTITPENFRDWLAGQKRIFGDSLPVAPLAPQSWVQIDPMAEAQVLFGKDRVVAVAPHSRPEGDGNARS